MDVAMVYTLRAQPVWVCTSPAVVMVRIPVMKVDPSWGEAIGSGSQRIWAMGGIGASSGADLQYLTDSVGVPSSVDTRVKSPQCATLGGIRYSQERSLVARGAVKGDPLSCSAYSPKATFCGEFRPIGSAPSNASLSKPFPNPLI